MQDDQMTPEQMEAKKQALMRFQKSGLFNPQTDDPENLLGQNPQPAAQPGATPGAQMGQAAQLPGAQPMAQSAQPAQDQQTMQANPQALTDVLKRKKEQEMMDQLFPKR